jgi:AcrR family transcriptional regulator
MLCGDMNEHSLIHSGAVGTRRRLVEAAERVIRAKGLGRATTKEIAREAGLAEGTLYLHFADKLDLIRAVQEQLLPAFVNLLIRLPDKAGSRTVEANLTEVAEQAMTLYRDFQAVSAGVFADPELLGRHRKLLRDRGDGPQQAYAPIVAYLQAEQALGRVTVPDPLATAVLLLGACQQYVFVEQLIGADLHPLRDRPNPAASLVQTLLAGLTPRQPTDPKRTETRV